MFVKWRILLKQAHEAMNAGRLEEAHRLATRAEVREFRGARRLLAKLAVAYSERADQRLKAGQSSAAWCDLEQADKLGAAPRKLSPVREALLQRQGEEANQYLQAGQPQAALSLALQLQRRGAGSPELRRIKQASATWQTARELGERGEFSQALERFREAQRLLPTCPALTEGCQQTQIAQEKAAPLLQAISQALVAQQWTQALSGAQALLALAPKHPAALKIRNQAWENLGVNVPSTGFALPGEPRPKNGRGDHFHPHHAAAASAFTMPAAVAHRASQPPAAHGAADDRFLLWVDAVGGYYVCLGQRVTIGQPGGAADVPILGDVSAVHATLVRDEEGWVLQAHRPTLLDGNPVKELVPLRDGQEIVLGSSVRLRFRQPSPVSTTARLEFVSQHRLPWSVKAILLMSDACVLGPRLHNHVVCPRWSGQVVLYQEHEELRCRSEEAIEINGQAAGNRGVLSKPSKVVGENFSFSLEPLVQA